MRAAPQVRRMSVVLGDDVIRTRVAANLRSVSVLVLDCVIGAGEGDLAGGLHIDGIRGAVDRDLGDGLALDVVVRAVDDDGLRARGDLDVRVGLIDRESTGGIGLAGVGGRVGLGVRARVARRLGGGRSRGGGGVAAGDVGGLGAAGQGHGGDGQGGCGGKEGLQGHGVSLSHVDQLVKL